MLWRIDAIITCTSILLKSYECLLLSFVVKVLLKPLVIASTGLCSILGRTVIAMLCWNLGITGFHTRLFLVWELHVILLYVIATSTPQEVKAETMASDACSNIFPEILKVLDSVLTLPLGSAVVGGRSPNHSHAANENYKRRSTVVYKIF